MTVRTLPNLGLRAFYELGEDGWKDDMDLGLLKLSTLVQARALQKVAVEPGAPALGDVVLLDETNATNPNAIAIWDGEPGEEAWVYVTPLEGWLIYVESEAEYQSFTGEAWETFSGGGGGGGDPQTESIIIALGDETTAITAGVAKVTMRMPYAFQLTAVRASLTTASSDGIPTIDINENGASILSTKLTIDATERTSVTAATPVIISDPALADDAEITFDIDVAGTGATGLKVTLIGHRV